MLASIQMESKATKYYNGLEIQPVLRDHEQSLEEVERVEALEQQKKWSPPPTGWLKCNIGVDWTKNDFKTEGLANFKGEIGLIINKLVRVERWRLVKENWANNRGAFLITQSVTKGGHLSSYVAAEGPNWLHDCFENEEVLSSG
ncbi:hypothetical protein F2Q70_00028850 [Brassica cretica]|uniref:Uncharacterized protein n=1 Tax=Brassica cretica TaxID=69181 RepID=A0A8S9LH69_BRACR|nr:hypothetical protein F2Q70_00028850 [Brassica cretica]